MHARGRGVGARHGPRASACRPGRSAADGRRQRTEQIVGRAAAQRGRADAERQGDRRASCRRWRVARCISVEDPETSSDASMSPVVRRFAEILGGWAKVESTERGGSSFRVFLPEAGRPPRRPRRSRPSGRPRAADRGRRRARTRPGRPGAVGAERRADLAQELRRLATEMPKEPERSSRRSRAKR